MSLHRQAGFQTPTRLAYSINSENRATHYLTGQEFQSDFVSAQRFGDWAVGIGGCARQQTTDDVVNGAITPNRQEQVVALGPQQRRVPHISRTMVQAEGSGPSRPQLTADCDLPTLRPVAATATHYPSPRYL